MCYFEVTVEQMGIHFELKTLKEMSFHHDYFKTALDEQKVSIFKPYKQAIVHC